ncbi:hypothetical protein AVEN_58873-1, partial [Araneus ventricosus]
GNVGYGGLQGNVGFAGFCPSKEPLVGTFVERETENGLKNQ